MKVLIIDDKPSFGGVTKHLHLLGEGLLKYNINITLLVANANLYKRLEKKGINLIEINFKDHLIQKLKEININKYDVINSHASAETQENLFSVVDNTTKVIITGHGIYDDNELREYYRYFDLLNNNSDAIINVSLAARQAYLKFGFNPDKLFLVYNGIIVDQKSEYPSFGNKDTLNIMYAGRLSGEKGVIELIEAAEYLKTKISMKYKLNIFGEGPLKEKLANYIKEHNLSRFCSLKGFSTDINKEYQSHDILVVPSESESCSYTILEAMASKIIVIASDVDGNKELVYDGITGYLFKYGDKQALAETINKAIYNTSNNSIIENAYTEVKTRFSLSSFIKDYYQIFKLVVNK